jgi:hypothetical protein
MNDTAQRRLARLAGLALATLLVCAIAAQMAAAMLVAGSGTSGGVVALSGPEPAAARMTVTSQAVALYGPEPAAAATITSQAAATLPGRGGIASAAADTRAGSQPAPVDSNARAAILFSLAAVLAGAVAWIAIDRRRRVTGPSLAAFCARNPADSRCVAT